MPRERLGEAIEEGEAQLQRILQLTADEKSVGWLPMTVAGVEWSQPSLPNKLHALRMTNTEMKSASPLKSGRLGVNLRCWTLGMIHIVELWFCFDLIASCSLLK